MKSIRWVFGLMGPLVLSAAWAAGPAPAMRPAMRPVFPHYAEPAALQAACDQALQQASTRVQALERRRVDGQWLTAADALGAFVEDAAGPVSLLANVHPSKALRTAAEACELRWQDFSSTLAQNQRLLAAARKVRATDALDATNLRLMLEGFEDAGATLPPAQRARAKQLADLMAELEQKFQRNVRDDASKLPFTVAELDGVPETVWSSAPRDAEGRVLLGLDYPTAGPVVESAHDAGARERMWRARQNQGGTVNLGLLGEIVQKRRELAGLYGLSSYADYVLRRRMAQSTQRALSFLADVKTAVAEGEARDLADLRTAKARDLGQATADTRLQRWDYSYYAERLRRERYSLDQEQFRDHFPPEASLQFVMRLAERLFGVRYERLPAAKGLWHPEVQAYQAVDTQSGKLLAHLMVDLYPREGKYNHAAVFSYRGGSTRLKRLPQAALLVNFSRKGLTLDELETLLHEFGHALHSNLSATRYMAQSGTSTQRDFVEAPSQMLEDWVYDERVLELMREVCPSCKPVPPELLKKAVAAKDFAKGAAHARQHLYASYDLELHTAGAPEPMATWARMEGATPLGHVPGTLFPANFGHIAGGYAAGYYGYLWSEVAALDLRTAFATNKLDATAGQRYRRTVLARGGERPPADLLRDFLGRESNAQAFYQYLRR
jgi:thimet oligopeptidase